jgi:hypothetical protein
VKIVRTRRGARIVEGGLVLSEIRRDPGPTNSLFDVLAAAVAALVPGTKVAVLGFAGGGIVAPLRALGFGHPIHAVDLSLEGEALFRSLAGPWAGEVEVDEDDAVRWLRRRRTTWHLILEDLSATTSLGVTKPAASLDVLPALMKRRLGPRGLAVTNVLPVPGLAWDDLLASLAEPWEHAVVVHLEAWENRVLVASRAPLDARAVSRTLRRHLDALGSNQARGLAVRTLRRQSPGRRDGRGGTPNGI